MTTMVMVVNKGPGRLRVSCVDDSGNESQVTIVQPYSFVEYKYAYQGQHVLVKEVSE